MFGFALIVAFILAVIIIKLFGKDENFTQEDASNCFGCCIIIGIIVAILVFIFMANNCTG